MATSLEVMCSFMKALSSTNLCGMAALDRAVDAVSARFSTMQEVIDSLYADMDRSASPEAFLKEYCNIDLNNADTGAISGADASGGPVKTAESIVPEDFRGGEVSFSFPYTYRGLTIYTEEDTSKWTEAERKIAAGITNYWLPGCLDLIEESYGISFETGTVHPMRLEFYDDPYDGGLAGGGAIGRDYYGVATEYILRFNMAYLKDFSWGDGSGYYSPYNVYVDRVLVHELVHCCMQANIRHFGYTGYDEYGNISRRAYPIYIWEGFPELVHGIDDDKAKTILMLAGRKDLLDEVFHSFMHLQGGQQINAYGGGYILLRYLGKQVAAENVVPDYSNIRGTWAGVENDYYPACLGMKLLPNEYDDDTTLYLDDNFGSGMLSLLSPGAVQCRSFGYDYFLSTDFIKRRWSHLEHPELTSAIDASPASGTLVLIGNSDRPTTITTGWSANAVWGGGATADTFKLTGGSANHVWFADNDGSDTVSGFDGNDDVFLYSGYTGARAVGDTLSVSGSDAVVTTQGGKLTLSGAGTAGNTVGLMDSSMKFFKALIGGSGDMVYDEGTNIYLGNGAGCIKATDKYNPETVLTLSLLPGLNDYYFKGVNTIDGRNTTAQLILIGEKDGDKLYGGKSKNAIWGGGAGSQYLGGNSAATDFFWFGGNDGADTFSGLSAGDGIFLYDTNDINQVQVSVNADKTVTVATGAATLTSAEAAGELLSSGGLSFILASGEAYRYNTASGQFEKK